MRRDRSSATTRHFRNQLYAVALPVRSALDWRNPLARARGLRNHPAAGRVEIRKNLMDDSSIEATRELCDDLDGFIEVAKSWAAPQYARSH